VHGRGLEAFARQVLAQHFSQFLVVVDQQYEIIAGSSVGGAHYQLAPVFAANLYLT
jgi:hypothetical protein